MAKSMDLPVSEAAALLAVHRSRVHELIRDGELEATQVGSQWLVSRASLDRWLQTKSPVGRALSPEHAWYFLALASGDRAMIERCATVLSPWDQSRLRSRLRQDGIFKTQPRLRRRARVLRLRGDPGDLAALSAEPNVVCTGVSAASTYGLDIHAPGVLEAYVPEADAPRIIENYYLDPSDRSNVIARVVPKWWPFSEHANVVPEVVVGLDLYESDDARARRVGDETLRRRMWA